MPAQDWIRCPACGKKTRCQVRGDTVLLHFPMYCPKCNHKCLINVKNMKMVVIKEPVASSAEPMNV